MILQLSNDFESPVNWLTYLREILFWSCKWQTVPFLNSNVSMGSANWEQENSLSDCLKILNLFLNMLSTLIPLSFDGCCMLQYFCCEKVISNSSFSTASLSSFGRSLEGFFGGFLPFTKRKETHLLRNAPLLPYFMKCCRVGSAMTDEIILTFEKWDKTCFARFFLNRASDNHQKVL